jgi:hypothetical protein
MVTIPIYGMSLGFSKLPPGTIPPHPNVLDYASQLTFPESTTSILGWLGL